MLSDADSLNDYMIIGLREGNPPLHLRGTEWW